METARFTPNTEAIDRRKAIVPFNEAAAYSTEDPSPLSFILDQTAQQIPNAVEESTSKTESVYRPPAVSGMDDVKPTEYTVRLSNIPLNINNSELQGILIKKCGPYFDRCVLVYDKDKSLANNKEKKRTSRGIAYVGFSTKDEAMEFAKHAREIVLDSLQMCVELLLDRN